MAGLELTPPVFSILSGLLEEKVGLHYGLLDRELLQEKASARAIEAGFESLLDYYYFLRYDGGGTLEMQALVEALVVNETYFFREWAAIRVLVESFVEPWCRAGRRVRIWSAACATGEEPLSLAMLLDKKGLLGKTEIVASDISQNVLNRARAGRYGRRSVRQVPDLNLYETYISPDGEGYRVAPHLIEAIRWEKLNLLDAAAVEKLGAFDIVLCRNVLIYFTDDTVRRVIRHLGTNLTPDGALFIGVSESLLRLGTSFIGEEHGGSFVYRKSTP